MKITYLLVFAVGILLSAASNLSSQQRIAVLPFKNLNGNLDYNVWCYNLQDSLSKSLRATDIEETKYRIVPIDSVEMALAEFNLNPDNPQYFTDLWKAVKKLNVKRVVSGEFNIQGETIIINAKIYDVKLKLPLPNHQARDIFRKVDQTYDAVPEISATLSEGL